MHDLVESSRFSDAHEDFQKKFHKSYTSEFEKRQASVHYMQNVRLIHSKNRQALNYKLKVNHMTDMSREERQAMLGLVRANDGRERTFVSCFENKSNKMVPCRSSRWRLSGTW